METNDVVMKPCRTHGFIRFYKNGKYWSCSQCMKESSHYRRISKMAELKRIAGNKCRVCGYDRCSSALHFHHLDPATKVDCVSRLLSNKTFDLAKIEAEKCILLCANCHAEVEAAVIDLAGELVQ